MSRFKIEHGASKVQMVMLKTNIEDGISTDIDLMCEWSDNERKYIINELLRFAITQEEDFQKYKASRTSGLSRPSTGPKSGAAQARPQTDPSRKPEPPATNAGVQA